MRIVGEVQWYHHLAETQMVVEPGTELGTLLDLLGVDLNGTLVVINGQEATPGIPLSDGDEIVILEKG